MDFIYWENYILLNRIYAGSFLAIFYRDLRGWSEKWLVSCSGNKLIFYDKCIRFLVVCVCEFLFFLSVNYSFCESSYPFLFGLKSRVGKYSYFYYSEQEPSTPYPAIYLGQRNSDNICLRLFLSLRHCLLYFLRLCLLVWNSQPVMSSNNVSIVFLMNLAASMWSLRTPSGLIQALRLKHST